jgi:hypothetical protein
VKRWASVKGTFHKVRASAIQCVNIVPILIRQKYDYLLTALSRTESRCVPRRNEVVRTATAARIPIVNKNSYVVFGDRAQRRIRRVGSRM